MMQQVHQPQTRFNEIPDRHLMSERQLFKRFEICSSPKWATKRVLDYTFMLSIH
jgi:hypothetical protein